MRENGNIGRRAKINLPSQRFRRIKNTFKDQITTSCSLPFILESRKNPLNKCFLLHAGGIHDQPDRGSPLQKDNPTDIGKRKNQNSRQNAPKRKTKPAVTL